MSVAMRFRGFQTLQEEWRDALPSIIEGKDPFTPPESKPYTGGLTKKQLEMMRFIQKYIRENQISPSITDISKGLGLGGKNAVYNRVKVLENKGFIKKIPYSARSIQVVRPVPDSD